MSPTLYSIAEDLAALESLLLEVGGDVTDEAAEQAVDSWLRESEGALRDKLDAYAALITEAEARQAARRAESDRLLKLARADGNLAHRLRERLHQFFRDQGLDRVETERFRFTIAKNGGSRPIILHREPEEIPEEFRRVQVSADMVRIREALSKGGVLGFAEFGEAGTHLRIR